MSDSPLQFLLSAFGSTWVEWMGVATTLVFLWLLARQRVLGWPIGIVACACYGNVFFEARLYADSTLQGVYAVQLAYGWWHWTRQGEAGQAQLPVRRLPPRAWLPWVAATAAVAVGYGWVLSRWTEASLPWADAPLAACSVAAQLLQARKVLENWMLWIAINAAYAVVYWVKDLRPTVLLFAILIGLSVHGWVRWSQALRRAEATAP